MRGEAPFGGSPPVTGTQVCAEGGVAGVSPHMHGLGSLQSVVYGGLFHGFWRFPGIMRVLKFRASVLRF